MRPNDAADHLARIAAQGPQSQLQRRMLVGLVKFQLPNGPSADHASLLITPGDNFTLDGDEPVDEAYLLTNGYARYASDDELKRI